MAIKLFVLEHYYLNMLTYPLFDRAARNIGLLTISLVYCIISPNSFLISLIRKPNLFSKTCKLSMKLRN